jgi:hypothetical protein
MAGAPNDADLRIAYGTMDHTDLTNIAVDQARTIKELRTMNADLAALLAKAEGKVKEIDGEVTRLQTFSEAAAEAVLQMSKDRRPAGMTYRDQLLLKLAEAGQDTECDQDAATAAASVEEANDAAEANAQADAKARAELERAMAEQRELERERRMAQRLGRQQRRLAAQELTRREAGRDAVVANLAAPAPDAPPAERAADPEMTPGLHTGMALFGGMTARGELEPEDILGFGSRSERDSGSGMGVARQEQERRAAARAAKSDANLRRDTGMW